MSTPHAGPPTGPPASPPPSPASHPQPVGDDEWDDLGVGTGWRVLMSLLGIGLLVVCSVSVFANDNEIGTTALAVIGGVLVLAAAVGRLPTRYTWGDKTAEYRRGKRIERAVESGAGTEEVARLATSLAETPMERSLASQLSAISDQSRWLRRATLLVIDQIVAEYGLFHLWDEQAMGAVDGRIAQSPDAPFHQSIAVLVSVAEPIQSGVGTRLVERTQEARRRGFRGVLIVRDWDLDRAGRGALLRRVSDPSFNTVIQVSGTTERDLREALDLLLPTIV